MKKILDRLSETAEKAARRAEERCGLSTITHEDQGITARALPCV